MFSFAVGIALFMVSFLSKSVGSQSGWPSRVVSYMGLMEHMRDFAHGIIDSRPVIMSLSLTVFFLFLTWKSVESRRWR
jgi:ABC-2 type transport system permease protein